MKKQARLKYPRHFGLACPGIFFTLTFWGLSLLMGTATYFLVSESSSLNTSFLSILMTSLPFSTVNIQTSPNCPNTSRLLFSWSVPGILNSCYRNFSESPYVETGNGWWKCKSGLYTDFKMFNDSKTSIIWNLGEKFICIEEIQLGIDDFEYIEQNESVGLDNIKSSKGIRIVFVCIKGTVEIITLLQFI